MSKVNFYADLSGIDRRIIEALLPSLEGQEDGAVVDQLLNLATSLEGVEVSLVLELISSLQRRCNRDAVIGGLIEFCSQSLPKSQVASSHVVQPAQEARTERSASPNEHDLVETVSPQKRGAKGGIMSWFAYETQVESTTRMRPVVIAEEESSVPRHDEFGWKFHHDESAASPSPGKKFQDLPSARDFEEEVPDEEDERFDELLQQFVADARKET